MEKHITLSKNTLVLTRYFGMLRVVYVDKCVPNDYKYVGRTWNNDVSFNFGISDVVRVINADEMLRGSLEQ